MKYKNLFLPVIIVCFTINGYAQKKETVVKHIDNDGKTLNLKLTVTTHDLDFNFNKQYDVRNLNKEQVSQLVEGVIDSLQVRKYFDTKSSKVDKSSITSSAADDKKAIERVILNYVESFYEGDTLKAYASIANDLAKTGYYTREGKVVEAKMSFEQFINSSQRWKNSQNITNESPKKITVFEILDRMATAKVEALWGIDYFHLAKINDKWIIKNVLWQEYPKK